MSHEKTPKVMPPPGLMRPWCKRCKMYRELFAVHAYRPSRAGNLMRFHVGDYCEQKKARAK